MKKRFITVGLAYSDMLKYIADVAACEASISDCYNYIKRNLDAQEIPYYDEEQADYTALAFQNGYISVYYDPAGASWHFITH